MYYILVLEDHPIQRQRLAGILRKLSNEVSILESDSVTTAFQIAQDYPINLFYIDIELKDGSGYKFAEEIRKNPKYECTWMVFITSYQEHMLEAFKEIHCYDYLIKPYEDAEIEKLTQKLLFYHRGKKKEDPFLTFEIDSVFIRFYVKDIYFIEAMGKNCLIHTVHGQYTIKRMSLKNILSMASCRNLIQIHRAYIINPQRMKMLDCRFGSWMVYFDGYDKVAMVGFTFQKKIKSYLSLTENIS